MRKSFALLALLPTLAFGQAKVAGGLSEPLTLSRVFTSTVASGSNAITLQGGAIIGWPGFGGIYADNSGFHFGTSIDLSPNGRVILGSTDTSGSPGAATINKGSGQVSVASGASSVTVTNNFTFTSSIIFAVLQDNTDAIQIRSVVPANGSFTINLTAVTTGARKVGFVIFN